MKRRIAAALVVGILAAACGGGGGDDDDSSSASTTAPDNSDATDPTTTTTAPAGDIDVETIKISHAPSGLAADEATLWYTSEDDDVLVPVDLESGEEGEAIAVGDGPTAVAVADGAVWVALGIYGGSAIVRVDPATNKVVKTIDLTGGDAPSGIAAANAVWAQVDGTGKSVRVAPKSNSIVATVDPRPKFSGSGGAWIAATDDAVWVVDRDQGNVLRIDPATNKVVATIKDLGYESEDAGDGLTSIKAAGPLGVIVNDDGEVWVTSEAEGPGSTTTGAGFTVAGKLYRIDPETNEVADTVEIPETPSANTLPKPGLAVSGTHGWVIASDRAWHVDLESGDSVDLLGDEVLSASYGGVAIAGDRVWFAAETFGQTGNALFGVDPESVG